MASAVLGVRVGLSLCSYLDRLCVVYYRSRLLDFDGTGCSRGSLCRAGYETCRVDVIDAALEVDVREKVRNEWLDSPVTLVGSLGKRLRERPLETCLDSAQVRVGGQVLHDDLAHTVSVERYVTGQELVVDDAEGHRAPERRR